MAKSKAKPNVRISKTKARSKSHIAKKRRSKKISRPIPRVARGIRSSLRKKKSYRVPSWFKKAFNVESESVANRVRSRKRKSTGSSAKVKVHSQKLNRDIIIIRKETTFSPGIDSGRIKEVYQKLKPILIRHHKKIGKSFRNLYIIKIKYSMTLDGESQSRYFSLSSVQATKIKNLLTVLQFTLRKFKKRLDAYRNRGMEKMKIIGLQLQGYKTKE